MTDAEVDAFRHRMCVGKRKWGPAGASAAADRARAKGQELRPYRCPFCSRWHVGHIPSMTTVAAIAQLIRHKAQTRRTA